LIFLVIDPFVVDPFSWFNSSFFVVVVSWLVLLMVSISDGRSSSWLIVLVVHLTGASRRNSSNQLSTMLRRPKLESSFTMSGLDRSSGGAKAGVQKVRRTIFSCAPNLCLVSLARRRLGGALSPGNKSSGGLNKSSGDQEKNLLLILPLVQTFDLGAVIPFARSPSPAPACAP
jgi:hypothetical protein